jgi:tetraacyldisaccharide 4'-kinase
MAVCEDRVKGIEQLVKEVNPEVIVLDDNMQHRYVKPRQQIMLTSYHDLFYDDYILPAGNLRESRKGANRADVIIVSKCPDNMNFEVEDAIRKNINKYNSKATVLFSRYIYTTPNFPARDVILLTGLAETNYILNHVQQHYNILGHLKYKDHYSYTQDDIENWKERYKNEFAAGAVILTTAKDAARLSNRKYDLPLHVLGVEIHFCNKKELEIFAL